MKGKTALYPGTFDPITNGHLDIIKRASGMFDRLIIAVAKQGSKSPMFTYRARKRLVAASIKDFSNVEVVTLAGLLANECDRLGADLVVRGLRAVSDFEYEMMMALMNRKLNHRMETVFLMPSLRWVYLHSSLIREVAEFGGEISDLVPAPVAKEFAKRSKTAGRSRK
jgi:pantetheine-phosphate adenylyltransferase